MKVEYSYIYDVKTNGFYEISDKESYELAGTWPETGVAITDVEHKSLLDGQAAGKIISADSDGKPILTDAVIDYVALATEERDRRMTAITSRITALTEAQDDGDITSDELTELAALRETRAKLRRLDLSGATSSNIEWP